MRKLVLLICVALLGAIPIGAQDDANQTGTLARAQQILQQARSALGDQAKLKTVQSLSAEGKFRRVILKQDQSGEVNLQFLLPDKYLKTETLTVMSNIEVTVIAALNGDQMWTDSRTNAGGQGIMVARVGSNDPSAEAGKRQDLRAEFSRYLLAWLMAPPTPTGVEFSYVGEAESEEGRADVILAKGADNFSLRLFVDQKTHRLFMISYKGKLPKVPTAMASRPASEAQMNEMKAKMESDAKQAPQEVEVQVFFSDYRAVDGISLPFHLTKSINGEAAEEINIKAYKINPPLTAQKFEKK